MANKDNRASRRKRNRAVRVRQRFCIGCQEPFDVVGRGKEVRRVGSDKKGVLTRWCSQECRKEASALDKRSEYSRFAPTDLRQWVILRDRWRCFYCETVVLEAEANMDHVIPWPKGRTTLSNIVTSCRECNRRKSNWVGKRLASSKNGKLKIKNLQKKDGRWRHIKKWDRLSGGPVKRVTEL